MKTQIKLVNQSKLIVTAYPDFNPLNRLKMIAAELVEKKFKGTVIFDLLVFNGNEVNRFVSITFDGSKFDKSHISHTAHIESKLEISQNNFFIQHKELLENSVLSSIEIKKFSYL